MQLLLRIVAKLLLPSPATPPSCSIPFPRVKARFIFNPHSGSNRRNPHLRDRALEFIKQHGWDATVAATERPRHATEIARRAVDEGCTLVVAIGGDGTMNEVASALVDTPACFGLIPCGSG